MSTTLTIRRVDDVEAAEEYCRQLMEKHGLDGWNLRMTKTLRRLGRCDYHRREIQVSIHQPDGDPTDTVLHEIAHALTPFDGHGFKWRMKCREIGANPQRLSSAQMGQGMGYRIICNSCESVLGTTVGKMRILHRCKSKCCKASVRQEKNV